VKAHKKVDDVLTLSINISEEIFEFVYVTTLLSVFIWCWIALSSKRFK